jgi:predicted DCC family thiol-disulfide oxidoreductase YuxK
MTKNYEIIIYDGICVLCNHFIRFILKKDKKAHFKATNLQSDFTKKKYPEILAVDSVAVILEDGKILQKSKAVYYILQKVKILFFLRILIYVFPTFFSNIVYDFIALIRYKLFGKYSCCPVLKGDLENRIIE